MRSRLLHVNTLDHSGSRPFVPFLVSLFFLLFSSVSFSQGWVMPVDGKVFAGKDRLNGSIVTLFRNGQQIQQVITTSNGKFSFELPPNAEFIIAVTKPGYITKKFKIVTANVPADRADAGNFNPFEPDVTLFEMPSAPEVAKRVEAILSQPIAVYQYIPSENNFNYDDKYTQAIQQKLAELADLQKQAEKEMQDKAKNAAIEAQKQLETDNKYKAAIAKGDKALAASDYATAKAGYNEALGVKPGEAYPKQKLSEIDKLIADAGAQKALDDKYKAAIAKADGTFGAKDYANAKTAYTEASGIKPAEAYPKQKIAEIDKLLAEAGKQKELDEKYKAAIAKADGAFGAKDYASAKTAYTEASGIKPAEAYPKQKIAEIDKLLAEAGKQKELDEKYKAAIAKGDGAFGTKDYASAKTAFTEASGIKPSEAYPKQKLAEIDKLLADANKQKELDEKYKAAIAKADGAFGSKDYNNAKSGYNEALGIKPAEAYPKQKLAEIEKILANEASAAKQKEIDAKYQAAVTKGDNAFTAKDYSNAKSAYTEAGGIKPTEQYPKTKIAEIDKLLAALEAEKLKEQQYKDAIAKGDAAFGSKDYAGSKSAFTQAASLKPAEAYPKQKIAEIDKILAEMAKAGQLDKQYTDLIAKGDNLFTQKNYPSAKSAFSDASALKPAEGYPRQKIAEIDKLLAEMDARKSAAEKEQKYKDAIAKADKLFTGKDYANSKSSYNDALAIKPGEAYPKQKIAEIDKLLADLDAQKSAAAKQKEIDEKYKAAIQKGDAAFAAKDYNGAKDSYVVASGIKQNEQYPRQKINEINKLLADQAAQKSGAEKDNQYKEAIAKGDKMFGMKFYEDAKAGYTAAVGIKPTEEYPRSKLAEIDKILKDLAAKQSASDALNNNYNAAISRGDAAFKEKNLANAKVSYNEALTYKPNEQYPKDKLAEIEKMENDRMAAAEQKDVDLKYKAAIDKADKSFAQKDYPRAKAGYEEALFYKPLEKHPKDRLKLITDMIKNAQLAQNTRKENETKTTLPPVNTEEEKKKQFQSELRAKYPTGVTEEEFTEGSKTILRRVVIKEDYAGVYTKVTHNWGGIYCFKDGQPITEVMFDNESR